MDPVNGISQIVQILRRKLAERSTPGDRSDSSSATTRLTQNKRQAKPTSEEIKRKIGSRILALSEEDRQGPKAAQVFVESIIAWEFGEQLLQDPKFADLSRDICNAIAADGKASAELRSLSIQLQKQG